MNMVEDHRHSFQAELWPFKESENTACFTSGRVLDEGHPILMVFHDHDGEWQFVHGSVTEQDECKLICLGCAFERDSTIGVLADMPTGWCAYRDTVSSPWQKEPYENRDEG